MEVIRGQQQVLNAACRELSLLNQIYQTRGLTLIVHASGSGGVIPSTTQDGALVLSGATHAAGSRTSVLVAGGAVNMVAEELVDVVSDNEGEDFDENGNDVDAE